MTTLFIIFVFVVFGMIAYAGIEFETWKEKYPDLRP